MLSVLARSMPWHRRRNAWRPCATRSARSESDPDVEELARLSKIRLEGEEALVWKPQVVKVLSWYEEMDRLDVSDTPPLVHGGKEDEEGTWREDRLEAFAEPSGVLSMAKETEGTYYVVPKMLEGEGD